LSGEETPAHLKIPSIVAAYIVTIPSAPEAVCEQRVASHSHPLSIHRESSRIGDAPLRTIKVQTDVSGNQVDLALRCKAVRQEHAAAHVYAICAQGVSAGITDFTSTSINIALNGSA